MNAVPNSVRESWDSYFMRLALMAASRGTCLRRKVGAVLVQNKSVRGTGYNGAPAGALSCAESADGCLLRDGHCIRAVHAESNLVLQTEPAERIKGIVYCTDRPCWHCSNLLANSQVDRIAYLRPYHRDEEEVVRLMHEAGITLEQYEPQTASDLTIEEAEALLGSASGRGLQSERDMPLDEQL